MPRLDPKVAVHRLSIKKGVSPKKQPQLPRIEKKVNKLIDAGFMRGEIPSLDCKHLPSKEEKWPTSYLCGLS